MPSEHLKMNRSRPDAGKFIIEVFKSVIQDHILGVT